MKRRIWKWVLGIVAILATAIGGLLWSAHSRASAAFDRHERLAGEIFAMVRARPGVHPRLFDPLLEGDGWPLYLKAVAGVGAIPQKEQDELPEMSAGIEGPYEPGRVRELLEKYAPSVELLRQSHQTELFRPVYEFEAGLRVPIPNVTEAIHTARFLSDRALHAHQSVEDGKALDSILLGLAMGQDTGRGGPIVSLLVQLVCEGIELEMLRSILSEHALDASDLNAFAEKVDRLWKARPSIGESFQVEDGAQRLSIVQIGRDGVAVPKLALPGQDEGWGRSWRYLYSRRLAFAGALNEVEELHRRVRSVALLDPWRRTAAASELGSKQLMSRNPVVINYFYPVNHVFARDNLMLMSWTLMRVAVGIAWYESEHGRPPETLGELVPRYLPRVPVCPMTGKPLGYRDGCVWSVGKNGVDDGGTPGRDNEPEAEDGDVVWTVRRE